MNIKFLAPLLLALIAAAPATKPKPLAPIQDDPALPRVLLIGDSISIGYTLPVRERLKTVANVHRPNANCGPTSRGLDNLDKWLGTSKWDVIHFNFGLWDLKYVKPGDPKLTVVPPDQGQQLADLPTYEANLRKIVARLKETHAKLIWANITPVPADSIGRVEHDELKYNEVAAKVMTDNDIPTDDLHTLIEQHPDLQLPKNVHFTPAGYDTLADAVATSIRADLK